MMLGMCLASALSAAPPAARVAMGLSLGLPLRKIGGPVVRKRAAHQHFELGGFFREFLAIRVELLLPFLFRVARPPGTAWRK